MMMLWIALSCGLTTALVKGASKQDQDPVIGIDLGTTYSCVGISTKGQVEIIPNDQGNPITPSYVAFTDEGELLIGDAAKDQQISNPENTIFDFKRLIGRTWDDPSVQKDKEYYPFKIVNKNGKPHIKVTVKGQERIFAPEEISAMVLGKMKAIAEDYLGKKVTRAVVTVPAYFNDAQRQATKEAGRIAGLEVLRILHEPQAASLAYGLHKNDGEQKILVYDLGGGTFDISIIDIDHGVFDIMSTNGDSHLGGEDFDQRVVEYFLKVIKKKSGKDIRKDNRAVQKLRREIEKAKRTLSSQHLARVKIESLFDGEDFSETLTRAKFEELNMDLFWSTLKPVKNVLKDAEFEISDIDEVILVGGSTYIPKISELVHIYFNGKVSSYPINPDEAVAYGAAVQAGILGDEEMDRGCFGIDVNPLALGIESVGGVMNKIILRNTLIPTKDSQIFSTAAYNQPIVTIKVFAGERYMTKNNHLLRQFYLKGIPPAARGSPEIEVTFEIDVNGSLEVTAEEKETGQKKKILIENIYSELTPEQIEKMLKDAEEFAEEDRELLLDDIFRLRNELEGYVDSSSDLFEDKEKLRSDSTTEDDKTLGHIEEL
ncbi:hypothetical protein SNE40_000736 [Patella caerulea]|uniref:Uncharacterized protein n=1 Tax=Patella caerulea TaxID=87958 RepID=A0AAN8Q7D8_PATCE